MTAPTPDQCEPCQRGDHAHCPIFTCHCLHDLDSTKEPQ